MDEETQIMIIAVPREIKDQEYRVGLAPSAAYQLTRRGHRVLVEAGAGVGAGFPDSDYAAAGATLLQEHAALFEQGELIVKVKEPQPSECPLLRRGQILFTYLHLAASRTLTEALLKSGVTGIAYETVDVRGHLPLLEPMSEIAGRMSIWWAVIFWRSMSAAAVPSWAACRACCQGAWWSWAAALRA
jgi:alanine dehydrogenase